MRTPLFVRPLPAAEHDQLTKGLRSAAAFTRRRGQILRASARGATARRMAERYGCSDQAVRAAIRAFDACGLAALARRAARPATTDPAFDAAGAARRRALLPRSPREFGTDTGLWTRPLAAEVAAAEGLTAGPVSGETVRATLARLGLKWPRAKRWIASPDPAYQRKKASATA